MKRFVVLLLVLGMLTGQLLACTAPEQVPDDSTSDEGGEEQTPDTPTTPSEPADPVTFGEGAVMVKTKYTADDVVVADVIATDAPYLADPTGQTDSTDAIQNALYAVEDLGGGVVYLPAGDYLVTRTVFVPAGVVLQGDWQDPHTTDQPEYGTVILAKPEPLRAKEIRSRASNPLFYMDGKCGLIGLTFYYPEQNIADPVPYGYTIYGEAPRIAALRDITMINSYRGVGVGAMQTATHELMQNESLRICALDTAMEMYRSSEVGYTVDLCISPSYWADAGRGWACKDEAALRAYCKENTLGLVFNDLDDEDFSSLRIEGCRTAIYMPSTPDVPQGFWGLIYDVTIRDCMYGIVAEELCPSIGTVIAKAEIDADKKAIVNSSGGGSMKLCGITLTGEGEICAEGGDIYLDEDSDLSGYDIRYGSYQKPASYLYNAPIKALSGKKDDATPLIQQTLDEAAKTGGVVYIPAGVYSIYSTIRVPAGVQLRGPTPVFVRDASSGEPDGAVLLSYVTDGACIALGEYAGVNGLRIFCAPLDVRTAREYLEKKDPIVNTCVGIKGMGKGVYTYNVGVTATMIGVDFSGCDDHLIKQTFGCVYSTFAILGGKNGVMESCLNNPHFINRQNYAGMGYLNTKHADVSRWKNYSAVNEAGVGGSQGFTELRDAVLREYCTMITVQNAENQAVNNVFMYAPFRLITVQNSTATLINTSADFVGFGSVYNIVDNSKVAIVNALRSAGDSIVCDQTVTVDLYNRINTEIYYEGNFHTKNGHVDDFEMDVIDTKDLPDESTAAKNNSAVSDTDADYVKAGNFVHRHDAQQKAQQEVIYERAFGPIDISSYMTEGGYLHMWVYAEDMSTQLWGGAFEVSSSGRGDQNAIFWVETSFITHDGWNEVWLPLSDVKMRGVFNPKGANYLRIHTVSNVTNGQGTFYFDDIYFCLAESDRVRYPIERTPSKEPTLPTPVIASDAPEIDESFDFLYVSDCEQLKHIGASVPLKLNDDSDYVVEGDYSFLSEAGKRTNGNEIFLFNYGAGGIDISDYMNNGYLHLSLYVEDPEQFINGEMELSSSGNCDRQEMNWAPTKYITKQGWNEVYFPLNDAKSVASDFNPAKVNFVRLFMMTADGTYGNYYIDDIYFCMGVPEEDPGSEVGKVNANGDLILATCDDLTEPGAAGMRMVTDPAKVKEGSGAWWVKDNDLIVLNVKYPEPINVSDYTDGYLHMWVWVSDASAMSNGQIEITSGGDCDKNELSWPTNTYLKKSGWNELYLPLSDAGVTGGAFNAKSMNYMRIYIFPKEGKTIDYYLDDIRMTNHKD